MLSVSRRPSRKPTLHGRPDTVFRSAPELEPAAATDPATEVAAASDRTLPGIAPAPAGTFTSVPEAPVGALSQPPDPPPPAGPGARVPLTWAERRMCIRTIARHELPRWPDGCDLWSLLCWSAAAVDEEYGPTYV